MRPLQVLAHQGHFNQWSHTRIKHRETNSIILWGICFFFVRWVKRKKKVKNKKKYTNVFFFCEQKNHLFLEFGPFLKLSQKII